MKLPIEKSKITEAVDIITSSGVDLSNMFQEDGLLKQFTKELVERALEGELKQHLGYDRY